MQYVIILTPSLTSEKLNCVTSLEIYSSNKAS